MAVIKIIKKKKTWQCDAIKRSYSYQSKVTCSEVFNYSSTMAIFQHFIFLFIKE